MPIKEGVIKDATRITETLATLRHLLDGGASVVLCSHLGRPAGMKGTMPLTEAWARWEAPKASST